jgi:hypothetical protein
MGLNWSAIGNILGGHIENFGNNLENGRNTSTTQKKKKKNLSHLPPQPKLKCWGPWVDVAPSHELHAISISKTVSYIFGLG